MYEFAQIVTAMFALRGASNVANNMSPKTLNLMRNTLTSLGRTSLIHNMGVSTLAAKSLNTIEHPNVDNTAVNLADYPRRKAPTIINFGRQGYQYVVERFGKFSRVAKPGIFWTIPIIEKTYVLDTRQMVIDVAKQNAYTSDNVAVSVAAQLYINIVNVEHACYKVTQPLVAVMSKAQSALRSAIGQHDLDHLLKDRNSINDAVNTALNNSVEDWGVHVIRFEITELSPDKKIQEAMDLQSTAERERRSTVITAEGKKRATELEAEGKKRATELEAEALEKMAYVVCKLSHKVLEYTVNMKHIDMVQKLAQSSKHTTYFVPKDISALPAIADVMKDRTQSEKVKTVNDSAVGDKDVGGSAVSEKADWLSQLDDDDAATQSHLNKLYDR